MLSTQNKSAPQLQRQRRCTHGNWIQVLEAEGESCWETLVEAIPQSPDITYSGAFSAGAAIGTALDWTEKREQFELKTDLKVQNAKAHSRETGRENGNKPPVFLSRLCQPSVCPSAEHAGSIYGTQCHSRNTTRYLAGLLTAHTSLTFSVTLTRCAHIYPNAHTHTHARLLIRTQTLS